MAQSNGFDEALVVPALTRRKGWRQPSVTPFPTLTGDVITCLSGLPYNADHAACSPVLLYAAQEDSEISDGAFNDYLLGLQASVVMGALNGVFTMPQIIEGPRNMFSKSVMTDFVRIANAGNFCGWELSVAEGNYAVKVDSVALLMSGACTVTLYLYNDLVAAPLWTKEVVVPEGASQCVVNIDDLVLHYADDTHKTGTFYLGYYQDELSGQGVTGLDVYMDRLSGYNMVGCRCFEAVANYGAKTFVRRMYAGNYRTYGINVQLSSYHDFTNLVVRNASQFDRLLGLCMTERCISEVMTSRRSDGDLRIGQGQMDMLYRTLEGTAGVHNTRDLFDVSIPYKTGLRSRIERELWRMTQTFNPDERVTVTIPPVLR